MPWLENIFWRNILQFETYTKNFRQKTCRGLPSNGICITFTYVSSMQNPRMLIPDRIQVNTKQTLVIKFVSHFRCFSLHNLTTYTDNTDRMTKQKIMLKTILKLIRINFFSHCMGGGGRPNIFEKNIFILYQSQFIAKKLVLFPKTLYT